MPICSENAPYRQQVKGESLHLECGNDLSLFPQLTAAVQEHLQRAGLGDASLMLEIAMALEESLSNAVVHGNLEIDSVMREDADEFRQLVKSRSTQLPFRARRVKVQVDLMSSAIRLTVTDEGPGFAPEDVPDPLDPANQSRRYGRGLLLIRSFMDEVNHNARGNQITMVKRHPPAAQAG